VLTITNDEHNVPRIPKVRDVMMSGRQPLTKLALGDLGLNNPAADGGYYDVAKLFIPQKESKCEFVAGDTPEQRAESFARSLAKLSGAS
jgi:electron transfer flavoprotein beta subunit